MNSAPSLPAPVAIDVDRNGNVTLDPLAPNVGQTEPAGQRYVYDAANRLQSVYRTNGTPIETDDQPLLFIAYDALGRRVSSFEYVSAENGATLTEPKGTYHVMSGLTPIEEYEVPITLIPSATPAREFVWGAAFPEPLVMIDHTDLGDIPATGSPGGGEEVLYYLHDVLGSVVALANSNGEVVERYAYDPYGTTTILNGDGTVPLSPPIDPTSDVYYHDADMNDWIDTIDEQNLTACLGQSDAACVWLHDRDGDGQVDFVDQGVFAGYYNPAGAAAPPQFGMPARSMFDANGDSHIDLWDFYAFTHAQGSTAPILLTIFDANTDGTVSAADYATFAASQTAPGLPNWTTTRNTSQYGNPYMWTGQRRDATTGQYHFMFRTYSSRLGRWMQRDPLGYTDGVNLHEYALSEPTQWTDPLGLRIKVELPKDPRKQKDRRNKIENMLQELSPAAYIDEDGYVQLKKNPEDPGIGDAMLTDLIESEKEITIENRGTKGLSGSTVPTEEGASIFLNDSLRLRRSGKYVYQMWEVLWHEMIHALRIIGQGRTPYWGPCCAEEQQTIERMNHFRKTWNKARHLKLKSSRFRRARGLNDHKFCKGGH